MRALKWILLTLVFLSMLLIGYVVWVIFSSGWFPDLDTKPAYSQSYFQKKAEGLTQAAMSSEPFSIKLTPQEGESLLKLGLQMEPELKNYVKGARVVFLEEQISIRTNLQWGSWKKGVELVLKPTYQQKQDYISIKLQRLRIGHFPLPVSIINSLLNDTSFYEEKVVFRDKALAISTKGLPFSLRELKVSPEAIVIQISFSPLSQMSKDQVEILKKGLISPEAKDFVDQVLDVKDAASLDIEKAMAIYDGLSPQDKAILEKNMDMIMQDPSVAEILKQWGL